jgi:hypothetical protein
MKKLIYILMFCPDGSDMSSQWIGRICNPSPQRQENNYIGIATLLAMTEEQRSVVIF